MKGSDQVCSNGSSGTLKFESAENNPSSRANSSSWTDPDNNLWLFGGARGYGASPDGFLNDLWKFDTTSNNWTWMSGSTELGGGGIYGTRGEGTSVTVPGARAASTSWTDAEGNFWLFGGYYTAQSVAYYHNDLWKYDPRTSIWTWVKGSSAANQSGTYGAKGVEAEVNCPPARIYGAPWVDNSGNLWLFGGRRFPSSSTDYSLLNDLWMFNPVTGNWTWVNGSAEANQPGNYGTMGTAAPGNFPGRRTSMVTWKDSAGDLWLFGGLDYVSFEGGGWRNDLWKYNIASNTWTWMKGSNLPDEYGRYGIQGVESPTNTPGARFAAAGWVDNKGYFWLYGGNGFTSNVNGKLSDLWRLNPETLQWVWVKGRSWGYAPPEYGAFHFTSVTSFPGAKELAESWTDNNGNLWLFGGQSYIEDYPTDYYGDTNDLWVYHLANDPPLVHASTSLINRSTIQHQPIESDSLFDLWLSETSSTVAYDITEDAPWLIVSPAQGDLSTSAVSHTLGFDTAGLSPATYSTDVVIECPESLNHFTTITVNLTVTSASLTRSPAILHPSATLGQNAPSDLITISATGTSSSLTYEVQSDVSWIQVVPASGNITTVPETLSVVYNNANLTSGTYTGTLTLLSPDSQNQGVKVIVRLTIGTEEFGVWTWMNGSNSYNQPAVRSALGDEDPGNTPGALVGAASWYTSDGSFWLFGGSEEYRYSNGRLRNDLWNYQTSTTLWTWMKGSSSVNEIGVYGEMRTESPNSNPGCRQEAVSWLDAEENLWIYGGIGYGATAQTGNLCDLWKFNTTTGNWTWENGTTSTFQSPLYSQLGDFSTTATPGSRIGSVTWTDNEGGLWLFGGYRYYNNYQSDLWKYDASLSCWSWQGGSDLSNQPGTYGEQGVADITNWPGGRTDATIWNDNKGNIWLYGGYGFGETTGTASRGYLNDLWKFEINSRIWTWVSGNKIPPSGLNSFDAVYGTLGVPSPANQPGGRSSAGSWTDSDGNLWMFGGSVGSAYTHYETYSKNDVWKFDPILSQWTWMKGNSEIRSTGVYGRLGLPAGGNTPGARFGMVNWQDENGNFWMYGGLGTAEFVDPRSHTGLLNDLWKFSKPQENSVVEWNEAILY